MEFNFKFTRNVTYKYNGREYKSFDEMPDDVRQLFENAKKSDALPPDTKIAADQDEQPEDLDDGAFTSIDPTPGNKSSPADTAYGNVISLDDGESLWYAGTVLAGLYFLLLSLPLLQVMLKSNRLQVTPLIMTAVFLTVGLGVIIRQGWARITELVGIPLVFLLLWHYLINPRYMAIKPYVLGIMIAGIASFIFLLLPPVGKLFTKIKKNVVSQELRLKNLLPPPRFVPLTLRLSILFGDRKAFFIPLMSVMLLTPLLNLKKMAGGFDVQANFTRDPVLLLPVIIPMLIFVLSLAVVLAFLILSAKGDANLLKNGILTYGTLKFKGSLPTRHGDLFRLKFEYEANGTNHMLTVDDYHIGRLEDDAKEPILYDPQKPGYAMLIDWLPVRVTIDETGNLKHMFAFMGYVYAAIPVAVTMLMLYFIFK